MDNFNDYINQFIKETSEKVEKEIMDEQFRPAAKAAFSMYKSFVDAGFTEVQAMVITKTLMINVINANVGGKK